MIKKAEKLVCAFVSFASEKYQGEFELKNLLFTARELIDRANSLFPDPTRTIGILDLQNVTKEIGSATNQKWFVRGSADSLSEYYRLGCPNEVDGYDVNALVNKLMPVVDRCLAGTYVTSGDSIEDRTINFLNDYFQYIRNKDVAPQTENTALSSREAVWIAAVTLTYNEYIRTGSNDIEQYVFSQSSIAKLASVLNPQTATSTYSQITGQMVTQNRNNQQYAYLIPVGDQRRVAASNEAAKTKPEQLTIYFEVNTICGKRTVQELAHFIEEQYTSFVENGVWGEIRRHDGRNDISSVIEKIHNIISKYKADFERVNREERYKWEAVGCYKRNWDIEADNFFEMYSEAFKEASNLLSANMYWPYKMVIIFAKKEPSKVRELFKMLYNEKHLLKFL